MSKPETVGSAMPEASNQALPRPEMHRTAQLVRAAFGRSDSVSFEQLYARVAPRFLAWARVKERQGLPGTVAWTAEDLLQEVWLRALRSYDSYRPEKAPFFAWILGIAHNLRMEGFRRARNSPRSRQRADGAANALEEVPEAITSLTTRIGRDDTLRQFDEELQSYSEEDREILVRCAIEGETCALVALRLGLTEQAVYKRWQRLRARLREAGWVQALLLEDPEVGSLP